MEVKNKYYQILVERLEKEIERNLHGMFEMETGKVPFDKGIMRVHKEYIDYHREIIEFIKKVDKEVE